MNNECHKLPKIELQINRINKTEPQKQIEIKRLQIKTTIK